MAYRKRAKSKTSAFQALFLSPILQGFDDILAALCDLIANELVPTAIPRVLDLGDLRGEGKDRKGLFRVIHSHGEESSPIGLIHVENVVGIGIIPVRDIRRGMRDEGDSPPTELRFHRRVDVIADLLMGDRPGADLELIGKASEDALRRGASANRSMADEDDFHGNSIQQKKTPHIAVGCRSAFTD